ncbi:zinc-binding alcohol dehydrogenase family protein [Streptomyces sp. CBMA123]|uniref:quinone oxidoreductase family protein n=1 Tax=Streptomyces sp. CBMA123 TaxID=1896313 RepID=UPI001661AC63|nr:zinc-binding dehydrogenase [Streptomyces sp. CBMA123]MBD0690558.1 oxidoreductase [Streptomyces sp. CBMA123]
MRRIRYHRYGGPEVLTPEEADIPEPGPGQVLLRAEAIGANFVDTRFRRGAPAGSVFHRPLPGVLTGDVVGTVEALGPDVDGGLLGQRVAALALDAFAEYSIADAAWLARVPDGLDPGDASMLPLAAPVALGVLRAGRLAPGETVLVHAAAGGIGHLAVQLAKLLGAGTVIATAGSPDKLDFVTALGADAAVDYRAPDWPEQVRAAAPRGVDVVLDSVGGEVLQRSLELTAPLGRVVLYGAADGEPGSVPAARLFGLRTAVGYSLNAWRAARPDLARRDVDEAVEHFAAGRLRTTVHARLPLTEAATAHRIMEERSQRGRILLLP